MAPEAAEGGPIGLLADGDQIELDVASGRLDVLVPEAEQVARRVAWVEPPPPERARRGVMAKYSRLVQSASVGGVTH